MAYKRPPTAMKKTTIVMLFVAMFGLFTTSCSKDDDELVSLEGCRFVSYGWSSSTLGSLAGYTPYYVYYFTSNRTFEYTERKNSQYGEIITSEYGTYTIDYPTITLKKGSSEEKGFFVGKSTFHIGLREYINRQ